MRRPAAFCQMMVISGWRQAPLRLAASLFCGVSRAYRDWNQQRKTYPFSSATLAHSLPGFPGHEGELAASGGGGAEDISDRMQPSAWREGSNP